MIAAEPLRDIDLPQPGLLALRDDEGPQRLVAPRIGISTF
jgi:hypothetical protein